MKSLKLLFGIRHCFSLHMVNHSKSHYDASLQRERTMYNPTVCFFFFLEGGELEIFDKQF